MMGHVMWGRHLKSPTRYIKQIIFFPIEFQITQWHDIHAHLSCLYAGTNRVFFSPPPSSSWWPNPCDDATSVAVLLSFHVIVTPHHLRCHTHTHTPQLDGMSFFANNSTYNLHSRADEQLPFSCKKRISIKFPELEYWHRIHVDVSRLTINVFLRMSVSCILSTLMWQGECPKDICNNYCYCSCKFNNLVARMHLPRHLIFKRFALWGF